MHNETILAGNKNYSSFEVNDLLDFDRAQGNGFASIVSIFTIIKLHGKSNVIKSFYFKRKSSPLSEKRPSRVFLE